MQVTEETGCVAGGRPVHPSIRHDRWRSLRAFCRLTERAIALATPEACASASPDERSAATKDSSGGTIPGRLSCHDFDGRRIDLPDNSLLILQSGARAA